VILLDTSDDDVSRCMVNDAGESVCAHITVLHWSRGRVPHAPPYFGLAPPSLQVTCPKGHLSEMVLCRFRNLTLTLTLCLYVSDK